MKPPKRKSKRNQKTDRTFLPLLVSCRGVFIVQRYEQMWEGTFRELMQEAMIEIR